MLLPIRARASDVSLFLQNMGDFRTSGPDLYKAEPWLTDFRGEGTWHPPARQIPPKSSARPGWAGSCGIIVAKLPNCGTLSSGFSAFQSTWLQLFAVARVLCRGRNCP